MKRIILALIPALIAAAEADLSGLELRVRRSGWASVTTLTFPEGTVTAVGTPATQSNLARDARAGDNQPISNT